MCKSIKLTEANEIAQNNFFCGGFLADDTSVLLVHDKNTNENWINKKFPGGTNNDCVFYDTVFFNTIETMLNEYHYSQKAIGGIMEYLKENPMSPIQRTVTLEYLEETTLFPFFNLSDNVIFQQRKDRHEPEKVLNQFFFLIDSYIDSTSESIFDRKKKPESNDFTFMQPIDKDVKALKVYMFEDIPKEILPSHLPAFKCLLGMKAGKMDKDGTERFVKKYMHLM